MSLIINRLQDLDLKEICANVLVVNRPFLLDDFFQVVIVLDPFKNGHF